MPVSILTNMNLLAGGIFLFGNILLPFLLRTMPNIGPKYSRAIVGWLSVPLGLFLVIRANTIPDVGTEIGLIVGLAISTITGVAIMLVFMGALDKKKYLGSLRKPIVYTTDIGRFIGYLMAFLIALLA